VEFLIGIGVRVCISVAEETVQPSFLLNFNLPYSCGAPGLLYLSKAYFLEKALT